MSNSFCVDNSVLQVINHGTKFITGGIVSEPVGRFVDSRKQNCIMYGGALAQKSVLDGLACIGLYEKDILYGYFIAFDVLFGVLNEIVPDGKPVPGDIMVMRYHTVYEKDDGLLFCYMFLMHHILELSCKFAYVHVFDAECKMGHDVDKMWRILRDKFVTDGVIDATILDGFNDFFSDKHVVCSDGFQGRYYTNTKGLQYLPHTYYIDIFRIHDVTHAVSNLLSSVSAFYLQKRNVGKLKEK